MAPHCLGHSLSIVPGVQVYRCAMASRERYPLQALGALRTTERNVRQRELADEVTSLTDAELAASRAAARLDDKLAAVLAADTTCARLVASGTTAAELAMASAYASRTRVERDHAAVEVRQRITAATAAAARTDAQRDLLRQASAEEKVVERHRAAWEAERRRRRDRAED